MSHVLSKVASVLLGELPMQISDWKWSMASLTHHENIIHHSLPLRVHLSQPVRELHPSAKRSDVLSAMCLEGEDAQLLENMSDVCLHLSILE